MTADDILVLYRGMVSELALTFAGREFLCYRGQGSDVLGMSVIERPDGVSVRIDCVMNSIPGHPALKHIRCEVFVSPRLVPSVRSSHVELVTRFKDHKPIVSG